MQLWSCARLRGRLPFWVCVGVVLHFVCFVHVFVSVLVVVGVCVGVVVVSFVLVTVLVVAFVVFGSVGVGGAAIVCFDWLPLLSLFC